MENLEQFARERFEFNRQKQTLKEQQTQRLTVTHNGGMFNVDMPLMVWLYQQNMHAGLFEGAREVILVDIYDTPIKVDIEELLKLCVERWNEVTNDWYNEYEELKKKRRVGDVEV